MPVTLIWNAFTLAAANLNDLAGQTCTNQAGKKAEDAAVATSHKDLQD